MPGVLAALTDLARFVAHLGSDAGLCPDRAQHLRLAADELATNVITHGYRERCGTVLCVDAGIEPDAVWLRLVDTAPAFDPRHDGPPADVVSPLADRRPGGLGLYLVRRVVDALEYEYVDGQNRQTIVIRRGGPTGTSRPGTTRENP